MAADRLKDLLNLARGDRETGYESDPSWRKYLADPSRQRAAEREFGAETEQPGRSPFRIIATVVLSVGVLGLLAVVSTEVIPLAKSLPSPVDQFQAVLAGFHFDNSAEKRSNNLVVAVPKKRHSGRVVGEQPDADRPLPPYKGMIRAQLAINPLNTVQPFTVRVEDGHKRQNLEITPKALTVDIDEPDDAVIQTSNHDNSLQSFDMDVDISGPEADRIATVLAGGREGASLRRAERQVGLLAVIDKAGKITNVRRVNGSAALAQAAIDTARRSHFRPFYQNGHPVEMQTSITVSFTIPAS